MAEPIKPKEKSTTKKKSARCWGGGDDPRMTAYHDKEWGRPLHDDRKIFEFLILEGMQAGLSWRTILHKRENFRMAFHDFDPVEVARYTVRDARRLLGDAGIIRNKQKILAAINNAKRFLEVRKEFGSFDRYIWGFVGGKPVVNRLKSFSGMPARTPLSDLISRDLKARGFKFVGSRIVYAHLQATGIVNDHLVTCFRYREINRQARRKGGVISPRPSP
jgi:DNA-3-methyladenine glycosylase I